MSTDDPHNNPAASGYYQQPQQQRRSGGRYMSSQDEYSPRVQQPSQQPHPYQAPALSSRSQGSGNPRGGVTDPDETQQQHLAQDVPEDEYLNGATPAESIASGSRISAASSGAGGGADGFVTEPIRPARRGLTGKISTLFRRDSSRERTKEGGQQQRRRSNSLRRKKPMNAPPSRRGRSDPSGARATSAQSVTSDDPSHAQSHFSETSQSHTTTSSQSKRLFYSSHDDDDDSEEEGTEEGSFEEGAGGSRRSRGGKRGKSNDTGESSGRDTDETGNGKTIVRYRGFSTSIKSLFLDETVVCASMGCFGLILSNRTEYLLNLRNERRGALKRHQNVERKKLPSRIVAYGLLVTILLMFATFVVWGTGNGLTSTSGSNNNRYFDPGNNDNRDYDDYYVADDDGNQNNNNNDDGNVNNNNNDDGNAAAVDDYYAFNDDDGNANNDDGGNNNNDDGGANANNQYNAYNNANNDDGNANNDDGNVNNDDGNNANYNAYNDYNNANNDDAAAAAYNNYNDYNNANNDDGNRRRQRRTNRQQAAPRRGVFVHPLHGIFKLRDYQEYVWDPTYEFLLDEWQKYLEEAKNESRITPSRHRRPHRSHGHRSRHRYMQDNEEQQDYDQSSYYDEGYDEQDENGTGMSTLDLASNTRIALLLAFLLFLGVLGRRRRMRTRFYLVRARAQEDHLYYASTDADTKHVKYDNTREDQYEGACSHTLCGWYPADDAIEEDEAVESVEVTDNGVFKSKKKPHNEDVVARGFNCLMAVCCGFACKCWFQCLSICALAQEAREIRLLVPPRYQRVDYITHQPFHEYQKEVNDLRRGWLGKSRRRSGIKPHWAALSRLSRYILITFLVAFLTIVGTLTFNPRAAFSWPDAVVLGATFFQSFSVLFLVHWIFHKSDLSLDAVIKMFAAGFLIAVPSAFFFEGLLSNTLVFLAWSMYELVVWIGGDVMATWIYNNWRVMWILGEIFNAYMVAAVTEEICKYYTFRAIEHPDLVFLTGLTRNTHDEASLYEGGLVKYPFASHQVQELNRASSFGDFSNYSHRSSRSGGSTSRSTKRKSAKDLLIERTGTTEEEFDEDENDARTFRQKAMAITTGMISVAVGLACAENFLYVFVLGGAAQMNASFTDEDERRNDLLEEWIILLFRSIFPIHALSAALQSINMIRKFVETEGQDGHRIGVGRVLLPAVLLHGTFDAILMGVNLYQEAAWENYLREHNGNVDPEDNGPYNPLLVNLIAWVGITSVMLAGVGWYYRENRRQRDRLKILEEQEKSRRSHARGESLWDNEEEEDDEDDADRRRQRRREADKEIV